MAIQYILSEEQVMMRDGLRRWAGLRDLREADDVDATWAYGAEQGWFMAGLPELAGGLGGNAFDSAIIAEELGRALVRAPVVEIGMVTARLLLVIAPERVEAIALGTSRPLLAHDEPAARGDVGWIETTATQLGNDWFLTGRKTGIVGAGHADTLLVSALTQDGPALFELAPAVPWLKTWTSIDDRSAGELRLDAAPAALIAQGPAVTDGLRAAMNTALVLESAEALGAMERALEMTRNYLSTRRQFGQALAEFQVLRHRLADMFIETEQARSIILRGLEAISEPLRGDASQIVAAVKARVAQAGLYVGGQAIQVHGGIGVTNEYPIGHIYKRILAFSQRHGGEARQVERYAEMRGQA